MRSYGSDPRLTPARRRGISLIEIVVCAFLLLLLMGCLNLVLALSLDCYGPAMSSVRSQQRAMLALTQLTRALAGAAQTSVRTDGSGGILFLSADHAGEAFQYSSSGTVLWQKYVCFYLDSRDTGTVLVRKEKAISPTDRVPPTPWTVADFRADATLPTTVVARDIVSLHFACSGRIEIEVGTQVDEDAITLRGAVNLFQ